MGPVGPRVVVSPMGATGWPGFRGLRPWTRPAGVRVDGPLARGLWPPNGGRLCSLSLRGQGERFLGLTGLMAGEFLGLTALQAEGCGIALTGDEYEVSVTGFTFSVI